MMAGKLIVISGPSGVGKGTVIDTLLERHPKVIVEPVTVTTRPSRPGEEGRRKHIFVSEAEFKRLENQDKFLEHAKYDLHYYGTLREPVEKALKTAEDVILEVNVHGAQSIKKAFPEAISILIVPPDIEELKRRLENRHTENQHDLDLRIAKASDELESGKTEFDHLVINPTGHPEKAVAEIENILGLV